MSNWTHKVVKQMRGGDGKFFDYPTAGTFPSFQAACEFAEKFAADQKAAGITTALFCVRPRKSGGESKVIRI